MSANLIEAVRHCLMQGLDNANAISHKTGMPIESVYEALVTLESSGNARVNMRGYPRYFASWGVP